MSDTWLNIPDRTSDLSSMFADLNSLMANLRLIKGGTASSTPSKTLEALITEVAAIISAPTRLLFGEGKFTYNTTTTFDVSAITGIMDDTQSAQITLSAITKSLSSWAAGTGNGGLDTGSIAASTAYDVYAIKKDSDGSGDVLFCVRGNSPSMPSGYTYKKYLFAFMTNGSSQILKMVQTGNRFHYDGEIDDLPRNTPTSTNRTLLTVTVPKNCIGRFLHHFEWAATSTVHYAWMKTTWETDVSPDATHYTNHGRANAAPNITLREIDVDASQQVAYRCDVTTSAVLRIATLGWIDPRI